MSLTFLYDPLIIVHKSQFILDCTKNYMIGYIMGPRRPSPIISSQTIYIVNSAK